MEIESNEEYENPSTSTIDPFPETSSILTFIKFKEEFNEEMRGEDPKEKLEKKELEENKLPPSNSTKLTSFENMKLEILEEEKSKDPPDWIEKREEDEIIPPNNFTSSKDKVTFSPIEISTPSSTTIEEEELGEEREIERGEEVD